MRRIDIAGNKTEQIFPRYTAVSEQDICGGWSKALREKSARWRGSFIPHSNARLYVERAFESRLTPDLACLFDSNRLKRDRRRIGSKSINQSRKYQMKMKLEVLVVVVVVEVCCVVCVVVFASKVRKKKKETSCCCWHEST